jgi:hypothetical protein
MDDQPRRPAVEPEIIPPDRTGAARDAKRPWARVSIRTPQGSYDYAAKPGPVTIMLAILAFGGLAAIVLLILLGTILVLIPALAVLIALLILSAFLGRNARRIRGP